MEMVECSLVATLAPRSLPGRVRKALPRPAVLGGRARARLRVRSAGLGREQPPPPQQAAVRASGPDHGGRALGQAAVGLAAAAVVSLTGFSGDVSPLPTPPARAESLTVAFPVSKAREVSWVPEVPSADGDPRPPRFQERYELYKVNVCLGCWQVNRVQKTLVETWGLIRETFVDPTFNHQGTAPNFA